MGRPRPGDRRHAAPRSAGRHPLRRVAAPFGRGRPAPRLHSAGVGPLRASIPPGSARSAPPFRRMPLRGTAHGSPGARPGRAARDSHDRACSPTIFAGAAGFGPPATLPKAARPASGSPGERLVETPGAGPRAAPSWCRCAGKRCRGPGHSLPWPRAFPAVAPGNHRRGPGQSAGFPPGVAYATRSGRRDPLRSLEPATHGPSSRPLARRMTGTRPSRSARVPPDSGGRPSATPCGNMATCTAGQAQVLAGQAQAARARPATAPRLPHPPASHSRMFSVSRPNPGGTSCARPQAGSSAQPQ